MFYRILRKFLRSDVHMTQFRTFCSDTNQNSQLIGDYFGLRRFESDKLIYKHKLSNVESDRIMDILKFLGENGYSKQDILDKLRVLRVHPLTVEQRYMFLKESGFTSYDLSYIYSFRQISNQPVIQLKMNNIIPKDHNVAENYKQYLNPLPDDFSVSDLKEDLLLRYIHLEVMKRYLCWRLQTNMEVIERTFRIHHMIQNKSFQLLSENLALVEGLGFPPERLLKYGYLLHNHPKYTKTALEEFPNIAGANLREAMRLYPKLVMVAPKNYVKIYGYLKEFNIDDELIRNAMNIFHLSPETVKLRLQEISSVPELKALLHNPRILRLIIHYNRTRSRLSFLQQLELKCANFMLFDTSPENFESYITDGKDVNSIKELNRFLCSLFNVKTLDTARWKKHPFYRHIPYLRMEETYNFLRSIDYSNTSILKTMHIILYPKYKLEEVIEKMKKCDAIIKNKLSKTQKLNLMLYFLEKEHHFTGNGVWSKKAVTT